jgi:ankyrin repeat protein
MELNDSTKTIINEEEQDEEQEQVTKYGLLTNIKEFLFAPKRQPADKIHPESGQVVAKKKNAIDHRSENAILKAVERFRDRDFFDLNKKKMLEELKSHVTSLINRGSNINYQDQFKDNVLLEACKCSPMVSFELFRFLITNGAQIKPNSYGHTVLHYAASYHNNFELFTYIIDNYDRGSVRPFQFINNKNYIYVDLFIDRSMLEAKTYEEGQTPLHYAAKRGQTNMVSKLIKICKANKEALDSQSKSILINKLSNIIQLNIPFNTFQDRTPLFLAAEYGKYLIIHRLI